VSPVELAMKKLPFVPIAARASGGRHFGHTTSLPKFTNQHVQRNADTKNFILSVLRSTATKREAKQYISKYTPLGDANRHGQHLRISIIKIRDYESIRSETLNQLTATISRLVKLGVSPIIVVDAETERAEFVRGYKLPFGHYNRKISNKAWSMISFLEGDQSSLRLRARPIESLYEVTSGANSGNLRPTFIGSITRSLFTGIIPVVIPIAYDAQTAEQKLVNANNAVCALVEGLMNSGSPLSVEKVIFIDPLGGVPSLERGGKDASHIFVNLEQEFTEISAELMQSGYLPCQVRDVHLANLKTMQRALSLLPLSSGGLITTPQVAALCSSRNPIIYNLLTDRPVVSPSLPVSMKRTPVLQTTIFRKGMPLQTMYSETGIDLVKEAKIGRIDLSQLTNLINDSFGKKLDVEHYLNRINRNVAGIIIAGDYEGAAIISWEDSKNNSSRVAYLDKFAVRASSQGGSGVADMIFKAMMRMFPDELLWRSRGNNPVNKWYFERSIGTMRVPGTHWVMFWNGSETREETSLGDYLDICSSIEPSLR
jgi:amino-acid N-acetyltransferase